MADELTPAAGAPPAEAPPAAVETPAPAEPAPEAPPPAGADARRAAAIAKIDAMVSQPFAGGDLPAEEAAPEPTAAEAAPAPVGDSKVTTLQARLVRQDRELQALRSAQKGAITLQQLQADPLAALKAAGHSPDKLLDLWLGTPAAAAKPDGEQRTPAEIVQLRQQIQQMGAYLQQQQQQAQAAQVQQQQQQALQTVHSFVTAPAAGERWETIAARAGEGGLASDGGGAYHLAVEVGNILANRAIEQLGPYATREEKVAAASSALEEALDRVESHLLDDAKKRQESYGKVKKLRATPAPPAPKVKAMPAAPSSETKPPRPLTIEERRKNAARKVEALQRKE